MGNPPDDLSPRGTFHNRSAVGNHRQSRIKTSKILWWLPGLLGMVLLSLPAQASELLFWRFDRARTRLEFRTSQAVQPTAQLIANPTRLVIDLPGIVLGRPALRQEVGGIIRSLRVAQFDRQTTRIVVELAPGYTLDPSQVRFRGTTPTNWSVQLPSPQAIAESERFASTPDQETNSAVDSSVHPLATRRSFPTPSFPTPTPSSTTPTPSSSSPNSTTPIASSPPGIASSGTGQLTNVRVTPDGLFLDTTVNPQRINIQRSRNRSRIEINLNGIALSPRFRQRQFKVNRFGIEEIRVSQEESSPPRVRLLLEVDRNGPDWVASSDRSGNVILLPQGGGIAANRPQGSFSLIPGAMAQSAPERTLATIEDIDLGGNQLLIRSDGLASPQGNRPLFYTTGWERNLYRIRIRDAQLSPRLNEPRLGSGSALSGVRLRQDDPQTVSILIQPANGVRILGATPGSNGSILVQLHRSNQPSSPPPEFPAPSISIPPIASPQPPASFPNPTGRRVVFIDPGHGGPDPGAIGIGGIRETDIVLDISLQVARILQQQGVIVHLSRREERDVSLAGRVALAERVNADAFLSIHANAISMSRPDINGVETFYSPGRPRSGRLATAIQNSILSSLNMRDRGVKVARFYVTRHTTMPSALVEVGFVTGADDAPKLASASWRSQMAQAIARGILRFLQTGG